VFRREYGKAERFGWVVFHGAGGEDGGWDGGVHEEVLFAPKMQGMLVIPKSSLDWLYRSKVAFLFEDLGCFWVDVAALASGMLMYQRVC
jgi:hypothetical protein